MYSTQTAVEKKTFCHPGNKIFGNREKRTTTTERKKRNVCVEQEAPGYNNSKATVRSAT